MNGLQTFTNDQFGQMRTITENGNTLCCGLDVAKALGYTNPSKAINDHCRYLTKRYVPHPQAPDKQIEMLFIPEGDVYRLITHSKLPAAERFEKWVFDEVLPSIRKHGAYMTPDTLEQLIADPDTTIKLLTALKEEQQARKALESKVEEDRPKVLFAGAVEASGDSILIGSLAKLIRQNGVNIGQNRLFQWMRDNNYLCARGERYNMPTQRAMEMELFEVKESAIANPDGSVRVTRTTKVTGKGQTYFVNKFLGEAS